KAVSEADVALVLVDPREGVNDKTRAILDALPSELKRIEIHSKSDLHAHAAGGFGTGAETVIALSAKTGDGLDTLKRTLLREAGWQGESEGLFLARTRHVNALKAAQEELSLAALYGNHQIELLAEHLRLAQVACGEITGEFTADDLLGVIFSRFCIGK
ncbi:tRNA uridine-5-carboxymethylaminomethyl(34) synthesis GTPase MnmE, partial [Neisseria meningitidis]|nr:tRNA uridine-5-carboxymethylaminomethyl(34) synthesis GTPase MnmE [Neisseria meningitidis]